MQRVLGLQRVPLVQRDKGLQRALNLQCAQGLEFLPLVQHVQGLQRALNLQRVQGLEFLPLVQRLGTYAKGRHNVQTQCQCRGAVR